jgi:hypothetical protein
MMGILESIRDGVVGLEDHLVCEEHINDAINIRLSDVLLGYILAAGLKARCYFFDKIKIGNILLISGVED